MPEADQTLSPAEVARLLGRSYDHVLRLIRSGRLPAYDDGTGTVPRYRVRREDVELLRTAVASGASGPGFE